MRLLAQAVRKRRLDKTVPRLRWGITFTPYVSSLVVLVQAGDGAEGALDDLRQMRIRAVEARTEEELAEGLSLTPAVTL